MSSLQKKHCLSANMTAAKGKMTECRMYGAVQYTTTNILKFGCYYFLVNTTIMQIYIKKGRSRRPLFGAILIRSKISDEIVCSYPNCHVQFVSLSWYSCTNNCISWIHRASLSPYTYTTVHVVKKALLPSQRHCSLSLWRVVRGSKLMHLDLIHGLFIT